MSDTIALKEGGYYQTRGAGVRGPISRKGDWWCDVKQNRWHLNGRAYTFCSDYDLIAEVAISPVLGFDLRAGESYETVKPDGTPGPVVELINSDCQWKYVCRNFPFTALATYAVSTSGELFEIWNGEPGGRISRRYVAPPPKPPTIEERLEAAIHTLARPSRADDAIKLIESCIADVKALEASKP